MLYAIIIFASFFVLRLFSLAFSIRNEKRLIKCGATQYGKRNFPTADACPYSLLLWCPL